MIHVVNAKLLLLPHFNIGINGYFKFFFLSHSAQVTWWGNLLIEQPSGWGNLLIEQPSFDDRMTFQKIVSQTNELAQNSVKNFVLRKQIVENARLFGIFRLIQKIVQKRNQKSSVHSAPESKYRITIL